MLKSYLIIERTALPDYFLKVVEARKLLENGVCDQVSEAVRRVGISRSTYYKYKDRIIEPSELNIGHKATLMLTLTHEAGNLSRVLNEVSAFGANILTITQSLPIQQKASVTLSLDVGALVLPLNEMLEKIGRIHGVESNRLVAID